MKFKSKNSLDIILFGKKVSGWQYMFLIFGYVFFLAIPWPLISGSKLFIPVIVVILSLLLPEFLFSEVVRSVKMYNILLYSSLIALTYVYTTYFLDGSIWKFIMHFGIYALFGYLYSQNTFQSPEED